MNDLSWLLYLADVVGASNDFFIIMAIMGLLSAIVLFIIGATILNESYNTDEDKKNAGKCFGWGRNLVILGILSIFLTVVIPSTNTLYAIAASEMGEKALKTPIASKAGKALEAWLDKQIQQSSIAAPTQ